MMPNRNEIERLRTLMPKGTRVKLIHMSDDPRPIPDGTLGTVDHVDDVGDVHTKWDNGRYLAFIPSVDTYEIIGSNS